MKSLESVVGDLLAELNEKRGGAPREGNNTTALLGKERNKKPSKIYYLGGHPKRRGRF